MKDTEFFDDDKSVPTEQDYRELQAQHDQLQSKYKAAMELLRETRPSVNYQMGMQRSDTWHREEFAGLLSRIDAILSGQVPSPAVPEGWQLVPVEPTEEMITASVMRRMAANSKDELNCNAAVWAARDCLVYYKLMLAAAASIS